MAYIGTKPTIGNFQICDAISVVNGQAAYTMQVGSVNVIPQSANHMIVSLNGVIQKPGSSFTVSGSTITFASNLATGDVIDFIQILGDVLDLGTPSDATVTLAKLTATGTKDATTFLRGDNTFATAGLFLVGFGDGMPFRSIRPKNISKACLKFNDARGTVFVQKFFNCVNILRLMYVFFLLTCQFWYVKFVFFEMKMSMLGCKI